jgi:hypothetical protein
LTERTTPQSAQGATLRAEGGVAEGAGDCAQAGNIAMAKQAAHALIGVSPGVGVGDRLGFPEKPCRPAFDSGKIYKINELRFPD